MNISIKISSSKDLIEDPKEPSRATPAASDDQDKIDLDQSSRGASAISPDKSSVGNDDTVQSDVVSNQNKGMILENKATHQGLPPPS